MIEILLLDMTLHNQHFTLNNLYGPNLDIIIQVST